MTDTTFTIDELPIPDSADDRDYPAFAELIDVRNAIQTHTLGTDAFNTTASESLPWYQDQTYDPHRVFVARVDGRIVGRGVYNWSVEPGATVAWLNVEVLPALRRRGIGAALADRVETLAAADGLRSSQVYATHTTIDGGERVPAPTGFGDLPMADPGVRFLLGRGYRLEQVERTSVLDLPVSAETLADMERAARAKAGADYRLTGWEGATPDRWVDELARLSNRMSVDAPQAGMDTVEETWDADRVRATDARYAASGYTILTTAVEHVPTGRLAGFTVLMVPTDRGRPAAQQATLVVAEHRGHRLGVLLKVANLERLAAVSPATPMVITGNAEENRYMLATNEALGFRAVAAEGAWQKILGA